MAGSVPGIGDANRVGVTFPCSTASAPTTGAGAKGGEGGVHGDRACCPGPKICGACEVSVGRRGRRRPWRARGAGGAGAGA